MIQDRMTYLPIVRAKDGTEYIAERETADMDRATTIKDIAEGQIEGLIQVLEINPVEGTCRDVTEDIAREVMTSWADRDEPLTYSQYEFVELFVGTRAARCFMRAA